MSHSANAENNQKSKNKPQINRDKVDLLKRKFNILRKIKPLKLRKGKIKDDPGFDPRIVDRKRFVEMSSIWEKTRRDRSAEEKFYYRKEARIYHKYFLLYLSREVRRTRWTPRKELSKKFIITVLFIAFFAGLFALLEPAIVDLFRIAKIT